MEAIFCNEHVSRSRGQRELAKRTKAIQHFVNEFPQWECQITEHINELQVIANDMDRYHKGATIANITGSSAGAVGGMLTLAGIIAAPFTAGGSLVLTAVGASIGGAGAAANLTAGTTEYIKRSKKQKRVHEIIQQYKSERKEMLEQLKGICSDLQFLAHLSEEGIPECASHESTTKGFQGISKAMKVSNKHRENHLLKVEAGKHLKGVRKAKKVFNKYRKKYLSEVRAGLQSGSISMKTFHVTASVLGKQILSKTPGLNELAQKLTALSHNIQSTKYALEAGKVKRLLYGTPLALSKTARAVSAVVGALFVAWEIYSIVKDAIELSKGSKTKAAKNIRDEAQKIEDALKLYGDICRFLKRFLRETGSMHE
ncbi:apolipoprotein L3-like [Narcine bancroftii]|uniref:apolipoprotein L3-like n=1 Tax=Narcine bancroftii TaxID=1343680 RepID=UPI0038314A12